MNLGNEKLYRAWGGVSKKWGNPAPKSSGVCFSLDRAKFRIDAERLYAVMEYHNLVIWLTEFSVKKGTPLWIGQVDPGEIAALFGRYSGNHVYIERKDIGLVQEVSTDRLADDLQGEYVQTQRSPFEDLRNPQN